MQKDKLNDIKFYDRESINILSNSHNFLKISW